MSATFNPLANTTTVIGTYNEANDHWGSWKVALFRSTVNDGQGEFVFGQTAAIDGIFRFTTRGDFTGQFITATGRRDLYLGFSGYWFWTSEFSEAVQVFLSRLCCVPDTPDPCYVAALRILKYRFNSEGELRRKLRGKRFEKDEIDETILRLRKEKWLDDERFAAAFVRTRANKRVGQLRIRRELQAAGVSESDAKDAVTANVDPEREQEALRELCRKRARMLVRRHGEEYLSTSEGRNKLVGYLLKQGYDAALVYEALKEIQVVDHEPDS